MVRLDRVEELFGDRDVPRADLVVAMMMVVYADRQGYIVASLEDISRKCGGYGISVVSASISRLVDRGVLARGDRRGIYLLDPSFCEPQDRAMRSYMAAPAS